MTLKKLTPYFNCLLLVVGIALGCAATSCNSKDDATESETYLTTESVAITAFSLSPDIRVMKNLDSVYFSIDLEHGVVFNADSLPKGTNVTKLIPKISYPSSVTTAVIEMTGGSHRTGTVNYYANATDTIDFTGNVTLTLGTSNDALKKTYKLKVNVHKEDPDTIYWDRMASMALPSRLRDPQAQKAVEFGKGVYSLIKESDGSYTASTTADIFRGEWSKSVCNPGFEPDMASLTAGADGSLYLRSTAGALYGSADGLEWSRKADGWRQVIGLYGEALIGASESGKMLSWPEGQFDGIDLPAEFPVEGYAAPIEFANRWAGSPTIVVFGGVKPSGSLSTASWAFDGTQWADIADRALPALEGIGVVDYYSYLNSASNGLLKEFDVYLAFGGRDAYGNSNQTVYITYDHGINWLPAQGYMQLPEGIEAGYMVSAMALPTEMQSNLSDNWKARRRVPFEVEGDIVKWECPYIFLFGGYDGNMRLNTQIRSGVLQRITFAPLF